MKLLNYFLLLLIVPCCGFAQAENHPTMILVHGALFTSRVFAPVQSELQNQGYNVITVDTPGRLNDGVSPQDATLSAAVEKVCRVVNLQPSPVILVGHNQAGAIITQATQKCGSHIKGLIYVAAVIPRPGEKPFDLLSNEDNQHFDQAAPLDKNTGLSTPNHHAPIKELFMADADDMEAQRAINDMVPEPIIFAYNTLDYNKSSFNKITKYYIKTTQDLIISPKSQDKFLEREQMNGVVSLNTSHSLFISQPKLLAKKLAELNNLIH